MTAPHYHSHVDDPAAVGRRLKEARLAAGLSQRQLSFPGCSAAYISRLEAGDRVPSLQLLRKLAAEAERGRGVPRHGHRARRAGAAGARRGGGRAPARRPRARQGALRAGARGDERAQARAQAAHALARLRGETLAGEPEETRPPGGLGDPAERARVLWEHSRELARARATASGAARYARDALALLEYADDRSAALPEVGAWSCRGDGWWSSRPRTTLRLAGGQLGPEPASAARTALASMRRRIRIDTSFRYRGIFLEATDGADR